MFENLTQNSVLSKYISTQTIVTHLRLHPLNCAKAINQTWHTLFKNMFNMFSNRLCVIGFLLITLGNTLSWVHFICVKHVKEKKLREKFFEDKCLVVWRPFMYHLTLDLLISNIFIDQKGKILQSSLQYLSFLSAAFSSSNFFIELLPHQYFF